MRNLLILSTITMIAVAFTADESHTVLQTDALVSTLSLDLKPIDPFLQKAIDWLAAAQFENGGWGAGQHAAQQVRDPRAVQIDPATTAFSAMALMRSGSTINDGPHAGQIKKALEQMLHMIEYTPKNTPNITTITGTQPQRKLGQNIDVSMTTQFLGKVKPQITDDKKLAKRIDDAMAICIEKLERGQNANGSSQQAGWAGVLQSAMSTNALEQVSIAGYAVDRDKLKNAKTYQRNNYNLLAGAADSRDAAGIPLYSLASTRRATSAEAKRVEELVVISYNAETYEEQIQFRENLEMDIRGAAPEMSEEEANELADAYVKNKEAGKQLMDDSVLRGFGNNGGEEFLSFMMTSESMVQSGANDWDQWHAKMNNLLSSIQNGNGSWSGHHCITSPVFCTAAVIMTLTADRDAELVAVPAQ